jgi:hypothetical protein
VAVARGSLAERRWHRGEAPAASQRLAAKPIARSPFPTKAWKNHRRRSGRRSFAPNRRLSAARGPTARPRRARGAGGPSGAAAGRLRWPRGSPRSAETGASGSWRFLFWPSSGVLPAPPLPVREPRPSGAARQGLADLTPRALRAVEGRSSPPGARRDVLFDRCGRRLFSVSARSALAGRVPRLNDGLANYTGAAAAGLGLARRQGLGMALEGPVQGRRSSLLPRWSSQRRALRRRGCGGMRCPAPSSADGLACGAPMIRVPAWRTAGTSRRNLTWASLRRWSERLAVAAGGAAVLGARVLHLHARRCPGSGRGWRWPLRWQRAGDPQLGGAAEANFAARIRRADGAGMDARPRRTD